MTVLMYAIYLLVSLPLTLWIARTLSTNGRVFLTEVYQGNEAFADAVNRLLVLGFYLLNLGFVTLFLRAGGPVADAQSLIERLSVKIGLLLVVLGALHLVNVYLFTAIRKRNRFEPQQPRIRAVAKVS
ncbi:hypothetical protein OG394_27165 [Kribbella sp. NBC_01245]|uniref:hypothetical protein n=1 Tax=Kribbella sp. NBC_01245 TaxID=2903578 RepID=UPI002E2C9CA9|nr:hypothetical protein [Kribbella sp. NBC_01245]